MPFPRLAGSNVAAWEQCSFQRRREGQATPNLSTYEEVAQPIIPAVPSNLPGGAATAISLRVLLVEDEPADVELALRALRQAGFAAKGDVAQTPEEFIDLVRRNSYDVILADYKLPNWNGLESVEILRREGLDIPVTMVSGAIGELMAVECIKRALRITY